MPTFVFKPTARIGSANDLAAEMQKTLKTSAAATFSCPIACRRAHEIYEAGYRLAYCGYYVVLETTARDYKLTAKKFFIAAADQRVTTYKVPSRLHSHPYVMTSPRLNAI